MEILELIGRVIFGLFFIFNGVNHFMQGKMMAEYAGFKGVPGASVMVPLTGLMLIAGGLSFVAGYELFWGALLLAVFLIPTAFIMHDFWNAEDEAESQTEMTQFLKNLALAGAALAFMGIFGSSI